jgi:8-hydroxy-5-deazaflavin:NADPH oxidoreductase
MPAGALLAGVVEQPLRDVLPDGVAAVEPDRVDGLDFHGPLAAAAGDTQQVALDLHKPALPDLSAAPAGDIIILAVPYGSAAAVVSDFGDALDGKVIIDITNPVTPDMSGLVTPHGSSGAQEIAKGAPAGAHVVKAFNTIFGHVLAKGGRLDAFIAADDPEAKARVSTFIESLGLRPLDVGGLHMAATLEALGLMMIGLAKNGAGTWDIALNVDIG